MKKKEINKIYKENIFFPNISAEDLKNIAFIIPTTSNKRNYQKCQDMDFFDILYDSFLKTAERGKYKYSFYLGYDHDDKFYINNLDKIKEHFKSFNNNDKLFLIPMENLKGKVGKIWSNLAFIAAETNDFLYQIGDDIRLLTSGWENLFINYLASVNLVGAVGPNDINNVNLITQSFVHITHLKLFNYYFPPEIENWHVDDWINDIYPGKKMISISVKNSGGPPRYTVENNKANFEKILKRDKEKLKNILTKRYIVHFITYGNEKYENSKKIICKQAKEFYSFESITAYSPNDLDEQFKEKHKNILTQPRGGGYWLWKPYIINKKLSEIKNNEYLIYTDAGCRFNRLGFLRFLEYFKLLENNEKPIISFKMEHLLEKHWTNDGIFKYFKLSSNSEIGNSGQLIATVKIIKKCDFTVNLFKKLLEIADEDNLLYSDHYNRLTTRENFNDNRHDQSISSILLKLEGGIELKDETYFNSFGSKESYKYPIWALRAK